VLGGDGGHQRLGAVPTGHPEQVGAAGDRVPGQPGDVDGPRSLQHGHLGAERLGLLPQPEPDHLPATRPRVHDQERPARRLDRQLDGPVRRRHAAPQRGPAGHRGQRQQHGADDDDPEQVRPDREHRDAHDRADRQHDADQPYRPAVGEGQPGADHDERQVAGDHEREQQATPARGGQREDRSHQEGEQGEPGQPPLGGRWSVLDRCCH
jgi:hypothetical protein